jgi:triacylglycerol lipase
MRFVRILAAAALAGAVSLVAGGGEASAQATGDPIVFVHGWNSNAGVWNAMIDRFAAAGVPRDRMVAITYNSNQPNTAIANQVREAVNALRARTGAAKVDVITHSMGGLSSRYYVKNLGGTAVVDDWVSLGGPNHGTLSAWGCIWFSASCADMMIGSAFLANLNAGDETPGAVNYGTFWSSCDQIIIPNSSVPLAGATNWHLGCFDHNGMLGDPNVITVVRNFVA